MFKPSKRQLETIAILANARSSADDIAQQLHITATDFIEWRKAMLKSAADEVAAVANRAPRHWSGPR